MEIMRIEVDADLTDLIPLFLQSREEDLQGLQNGLDAKNFDALRMIGHSMRGSGSSYGFDAVSEIGEKIETAALAQDDANIETQRLALQLYLTQIEIAYV
jgi:HPt (histidine-containing phosphotransfer) domain-containing protein